MSPNTIPNTHEPHLILVTFPRCDKLTPTTYSTWQFAITRVLEGFDLLKFIDGSHPPPPETIEQKDNAILDAAPQIVPNPAHSTWHRQDRLLTGALVGTLSSTIAPLIVHAKTSYEAWMILANTYASASRAHMLTLKDRLASITKTTQTTSEYLQSIKSITDQLASMGKPMDSEDILSKILSGLDCETYKPIIDAIRALDNPISFEALHDRLLHFDMLHKPSSHNSDPFPVTVNAAHFRPYLPRSHQSSNTESRPSAPYKGRCHYCDIPGHSTSVS